MSQPTIIFDYDNTFTDLPLAATLVYIAVLKSEGHRVLVVSSRQCECNEDDGKCESHVELAEATGCSVVLTSGVAKKWFLEQRGIIRPGEHVIWFDDDVSSILNGR